MLVLFAFQCLGLAFYTNIQFIANGRCRFEHNLVADMQVIVCSENYTRTAFVNVRVGQPIKMSGKVFFGLVI